MDEKRNVEYKFRVTKSESEVIEKRFEDAPVNSMSAFLRQQVVHGIYLEFDKDELQSIRQAIQASANNINQIARRVNSTERIYADDMKQIDEKVDEIWQQLRSIQSILLKLNPYVM